MEQAEFGKGECDEDCTAFISDVILAETQSSQFRKLSLRKVPDSLRGNTVAS